MEHSPPNTDVLKSPLGIAFFTLIVTVGGAVVKDRLFTEGRDTSNAVRVDAVDRRLTEIDAANAKRFDQLREDIRDLKFSLEDRRGRR